MHLLPVHHVEFESITLVVLPGTVRLPLTHSFFLSLLFTSFHLPVGYLSFLVLAPVVAVTLSMDPSSNLSLKVNLFHVCFSPALLSFHLNYGLLCHLRAAKQTVD